MKLIKFPILFLAIIILIISCNKKDNTPPNYFSFKGKTYAISYVLLGKNVTTNPKDSKREYDIYQMGFYGVSGKDSATLYIAVSDTATNVLGGNYPSNTMGTDARGIIPDSYTIVAASKIWLSTMEFYYSGQGGSIVISLTGTTYSISMNAISAGTYICDSGREIAIAI